MRKKLLTLTGLLIGTLVWLFPPSIEAYYGLHGLSDVLSDITLGIRTEHNISFTLPINSEPIYATDYIIIDFLDFIDPYAATLIQGNYAGEPIFSVEGQYVKITNITVMPGTFISIQGASAVNPYEEELFQLQVYVTKDQAGLEVKNHGTVIATKNWGAVSVTATIPAALGSLVVSGYSSPFSFIIFTEDNSIIGTDIANSLGSFTHYFSGLQPRVHNITVYGTDMLSRSTSFLPIEIYTAAFQQTTISNQLLSPALSLNASRFLQGDQIIASGSAMPGADITIFTDSPMRSYATSADINGNWTYTITDTYNYILGDYRLYALAQSSFGLQSIKSISHNFTIVTDLETSGEACGDITGGDLNCDGKVDLTDFSILMYYWGSKNRTADINGDEWVNLTDFSIMMFYWGNES